MNTTTSFLYNNLIFLNYCSFWITRLNNTHKRKALHALFRIHELTNSNNWLLSLWLMAVTSWGFELQIHYAYLTLFTLVFSSVQLRFHHPRPGLNFRFFSQGSTLFSKHLNISLGSTLKILHTDNLTWDRMISSWEQAHLTICLC